MPRQHLTSGKDPVPILQEAGWASGPIWTGAENLAPPEFDPRTVQPVGSRYPAHHPTHKEALIHSIRSMPYDKSITYSKASSPQRAVQCFLCEFKISYHVLNVIH